MRHLALALIPGAEVTHPENIHPAPDQTTVLRDHVLPGGPEPSVAVPSRPGVDSKLYTHSLTSLTSMYHNVFFLFLNYSTNPHVILLIIINCIKNDGENH